MNPSLLSTEGSGPVLPSGKFTGRTAFQDLVRHGLEAAAQQGWRELVLSDATFEDWPLGEAGVAASLEAWSQSGRTITLLAKGYGETVRRHARFVAWRRRWDHIVVCRQCPSADAEALPSALWAGAWAMQRLESVHSTAWCGAEAARRVHLRELLDEWLRKSTPGFPATTLGL